MPKHYLQFDVNHDWQPKYELLLKYQEHTEKVKMLVDSGADFSLITKKMGEDLGYTKGEGENLGSGEGIGGSIEYLLRQVEIEIEGHRFTAPVAWIQSDFCEEILCQILKARMDCKVLNRKKRQRPT